MTTQKNEQSHQNRVLLVSITVQQIPTSEPEEFHELVTSTGAEIVAEITGTRQTPSARYFIGKGKAEEIKLAVQQHQAALVIFNHALTATQEKNLEQAIKCRVLDRNGLILDIFASRARSFEGKLQVELAQLERLSTRLVGGWTHLERQRGGIGLRGPGETQLETDRRLIRQRIKAIKQRLQKVRNQRHQGRRARKRAAIATLSLVGYTNAGKSTLFNCLTGAESYVADQLFATLDPTLRTIELPGIGKTILADTVGFMRDLPHDLIEAFRATLEETREADLLLHVIDAHDNRGYRHEKIAQVNQVLEEIAADQLPTLQVYNKSDLLPQQPVKIDRDEEGRPERVWLSAQSGMGIDLLYEAIADALCHDWIHCAIKLSPQQSALRAKLHQLGAIIDESIQADGSIIVEIRIARQEYERLKW